MAYNVGDRARNRSEGRDTAKKIQQESKIRRDLQAFYFAPLAKDFVKTYSTLGIIPNLQPHTDNLNKIVTDHYQKTSAAFIDQVRQNLGQPENAGVINNNILFAQQLQQNRDVHASTNAISKTTTKNLHEIVTGVIVAGALAGAALSKRKIAKEAELKLKQDSAGRLDGIAMTQTQQAAEGAKNTELKTLIKDNAVFPKKNVVLSKAKITKTWHTVVDSHTRLAHLEADQQKVDFNAVYTVGGESLRYPGDTSLGATVGNVINCRCASIKTINSD